MTEAEWLECTDLEKMLEFKRGRVSGRKLRLFSLACCERVEHLFIDSRSKEALRFARRFVEVGVAEGQGRSAAANAAREAIRAVYSDKPDTGERPESHSRSVQLAACQVAYSLLEGHPHYSATYAGYAAYLAAWLKNGRFWATLSGVTEGVREV